MTEFVLKLHLDKYWKAVPERDALKKLASKDAAHAEYKCLYKASNTTKFDTK